MASIGTLSNFSTSSNPTLTRLSSLNSYGNPLASLRSIPVPTPAITVNGKSTIDGRVRVRMLPGSPSIFYKDPSNLLLSPLAATDGVVFPFQPAVAISFSANYQEQKVVHSNFAFRSYENSELKPITLTCDFPVRTPFEGQYVIAALHFFRCLTMMFTGVDGSFADGGSSFLPNVGVGSSLAGSPPLVVSLYGMGFGGLDSIPVAVTDVTTTFPDTVDYVSVSIPGLNGEITKVPTMLTISLNVTPMFSRAFAASFGALNFSYGQTRLMGPTPISPDKYTVSNVEDNGVLVTDAPLTIPATSPIPTLPVANLDNILIPGK